MRWIGGLVGIVLLARTVSGAPLPRAAYLGGGAADEAWPAAGLALDGQGAIVVAGHTASADLPTTAGCHRAAFDASGPGTRNGFLARLSPGLGAIEACTYFGVSDDVNGIAVVAAGPEDDVWMVGHTLATDLPVTAGAFQGTPGGGRDVFLARFDRDLTTLKACSYLGGSGDDRPRGILVGPQGRLYVVGTTQSSDLPHGAGAYDVTYGGGTDLFVACLSADLDTLVAATYLGGSLEEDGRLVAGDGFVCVAGYTRSSNFPTTAGAYDRTFGGSTDVFVSLLTPDLATLTASTFVGGSGWDFGYAVALGPDGRVYVAGHAGTGYPTPNGYDTSYNGGPQGYDDVVVSRLSPGLTALEASTFLGGSQFENCTDLAIDAAGTVHVAGFTRSTDFPAAGLPAQAQPAGGYDAFVARLSGDLSALTASTCLGGSADEGDVAVALLPGRVVLAGGTLSADLPSTAGTFGPLPRGGADLFAALLDTSLSAVAGPAGVPAGGPGAGGLRPSGPNPFRGATTLRFELGAPESVRLTVHDLHGRRVRSLLAGRREAGTHSARWDGRDEAGRPLPAGTYLCRLEAGARCSGCKVVLAR